MIPILSMSRLLIWYYYAVIICLVLRADRFSFYQRPQITLQAPSKSRSL